MIVRAAKNMAKGEEITLNYTPYQDYAKRAEFLAKHVGECDCQLCQLDRADGPEQNAERIKAVQSTDAAMCLTSTAAGLRVLKRVNATYLPSRGPLRPEICFVHHQYARALEAEAKPTNDREKRRKAIMEQMKGLETAGLRVVDKEVYKALPYDGLHHPPLPIATDRLPIIDRALHCTIISGWFMSIGAFDRAANWMRAAMWRGFSSSIITSTKAQLLISQLKT